jgi:multidrug efflux pump subunit AcrA (membrane-fusion protein)
LPTDPLDIFRKEALEHHQARPGDKGDALRLSPFWIRWTYALVIGCSLAGLLFLCLGRMNEYASGPAVICATGRTDLTAPISATVDAVHVRPGQRVRQGDLLLEFESSQEQTELDRVRREFELQLVNFLRDPLDNSARQAVASLRVQRDFARQRLDARSLRAPRDGIVADVRTRPGQALLLGQTAMTLLSEDQHLKVVGVLPGHFRPQLRKGMSIRLELAGYAYAYQNLVIEAVADEVIGPNEARRYLGSEIADAVMIPGAVILVEAVLPRDTFTSGGQAYAYHDGMHATMEVRVRSEPIILSLLPGLKSVIEDHDG